MSEDAPTSTPIAISERGVVVEGLRLATAMSDAPRSFLARAPLVVLPEAGYVWQDYRPILEHFAPERRVFAFDWPGFGGSAKPVPSNFTYTSERFALMLAGWLDNVGIARAVILGNGVGGAAATRYAAAHPERVAGLCLVGPSGFTSKGLAMSLAGRLLGRTAVLRRAEPIVTSFALGPTNAKTTALAERQRQLRSTAEYPAHIEASAALWRGLSLPGEDVTGLARQVTAPTMLVRGALDPIFSAGDARRAAEAFGGRGALEVTLPGAGHLPFLQASQRFFQAVRGLLETAEANAAVNN